MERLADDPATGVRHHSSVWSGEAQPRADAASRAAEAKRSRTSATRSGVSGDRTGRVGGSAVEKRDVVVIVLEGVDIWKAVEVAASASMDNA